MSYVLVLALAGMLASCATPHEFATPDASWKTRTGQLKYTSGERVLVGEVVVSRRGASDFQIEFQKGGGLPLLKLRMDATTARAEGLFARGSWQGVPDRAPKPLRGWVGLREAFLNSNRQSVPCADPIVQVEQTNGRLVRLTVNERFLSQRFDFIFTR